MLAIVSALKRIFFFQILSSKIVVSFNTARLSIVTLVMITYIGSMIIANDMALITFLPLGYYVLSSTNLEKYMPFTFIMQNIAANLGGMLTPFGNPQNLYLYSYYKIDPYEFMTIMALPFIVSLILMTACCVLINKQKIVITENCDYKLNKAKTALYFFLFALFITMGYVANGA